MRKRNIVMFALGSFLGEVSGESWSPETDILGGVLEGIAQIFGTSLLRVRVGTGKRELSGLVSRWRHTGIGKDLVRRIKTRELTDFGQNHSSRADTYTQNDFNGRLHFSRYGLNSSLNVINLSVQLPD